MPHHTDNPYGELALAVIAQAFADKDKGRYAVEVRDFFESEWCNQLSDVAGLDVSVVKKTLRNYDELKAKAAKAKLERAKSK